MVRRSAMSRNWGMCLLGAALLCGGCAANSAGLDLRAKASPASVDCASNWNQAAADQSSTYRIRPGDQLQISFYLSPEFDHEVTVRPDGKISMPVIGDVKAVDLTPVQLEAYLDQGFSRELLAPQATVHVQNSPGQVVYVQGEVAHPGAVHLAPDMTALQAISASGGMTDSAGPDKVILIRRDACGRPQGVHLNLGKVLNQSNNDEDAGLMPTDILIVPKSNIANANLIIKQYVRDMLPVTPYPSF
jgi:polysaccharide export outer membrane protein